MLLVLALVVTSCGGGADEESTAGTEGDEGGVASTVASTQGDGDDTTIEPQPFTVGKEAWQSGFHMTFGDGLFTGEADEFSDEVTYFVTIDTGFENLKDSNDFMTSDQFALVVDGNAIPASLGSELPDVPGGLSSNGTLHFIVDENFDPTTSMLVIGYSEEARAQVPLGDGDLVSLEPSTAPVSGTIELELVDLTFDGADLHYDDPGGLYNVDEGRVGLTLHFDVLSRNSGNWNIFADDFALILPDGTAITPDASMIDNLPGSDEGVATNDQSVTFVVPDPPAGDYTLRLTVGSWFVGDDGVDEGTFDFNLS